MAFDIVHRQQRLLLAVQVLPGLVEAAALRRALGFLERCRSVAGERVQVYVVE
jgi:hypothetical protein